MIGGMRAVYLVFYSHLFCFLRVSGLKCRIKLILELRQEHLWQGCCVGGLQRLVGGQLQEDPPVTRIEPPVTGSGF